MDEVIAAVEDAFRAYRQGEAQAPLRLSLEVEGGQVLYMPASFKGPPALGAKVVSVFEENPQRGLPLIYALYLLHDPASGAPLALMEGSYLTGVRTGATSAVAARYLAREDAEYLGIIGAGFQASFQARAISRVRKIKRVYLNDRIRGRAEGLAEKLGTELGIEAKVMDSPEDLAESSDILVTVTTSCEPVFPGRFLRRGSTVIAVGTFTPDAREVDDEAIKRSKIYVDSYEGALAEAGDLLIPMRTGLLKREELKGELGEVVTGEVPSREGEDEIILFKSVGLAIEDAAAAGVAYRRAIELGLGREVEVL